MNDKDLNDKQEPSVTDKKLKNSEVSAVTNENQVAVKTQERTGEEEIFGGYEVKNWDYNTRIYKIIGVATLFNLLGLFVFAQTNLISTSACESPFVSNVCDVLDTVYVGSKLFGNDIGEEDYDGNAVIAGEDVVWVNNTDIQPKLEYPTGYFEIANRDEIAAQQALLDQQSAFSNGTSTTNPPFTPPSYKPPSSTSKSKSSGTKVTTPPYGTRRSKRPSGGSFPKQKLAKRQKGGVVKGGEINNDLFGDSNPKQGKSDDADNNKEDKQENPLEKISAKNSDAVKSDINRKPFDDLLVKILDKKEENIAKLKEPFAIKMKARLTETGEFVYDEKVTRYLTLKGKKETVNLAKDGIEALGKSKFLKYLVDLDVKNIELQVVQEGEAFQVLVVSDQASPTFARTVATGLNAIIKIAKIEKKLRINKFAKAKDIDKQRSEEDQLTLLRSTQVTSQGKNFKLKVAIPRKDVQEMINRSLEYEAKKQEEEKNKKTPDKPNGTALKKDSNDNSAKK